MKAKVWNYGVYPRHNDLVLKTMDIEPLVPGVYTSLFHKDEHDPANDRILVLFCFTDDVCFTIDDVPRFMLEKEENRRKILRSREEYIEKISQDASQGKYINKIAIKAYELLGLDTAPLLASRQTFLQKQVERKRLEAEQRRLAEEQRTRKLEEKLDESKSKFLSGEFITPEDFMGIAKRDGFHIHIRTKGTLSNVLGVKRDGSVRVYKVNKRWPDTSGCRKAIKGYLEFLGIGIEN